MRYHQIMRTTIDIDDDVLIAAKELAQRQGSTAGRVLSRLAREALTGGHSQSGTSGLKVAEIPAVYGFRPFPKNGTVVTNESINQLRDQEGI
jgi:Arc/MetJ family transcription regulator